MNSKETLIMLLSSITIWLLSGVAIIWLLLKILIPDFFLVKRKPKLIKGLPSEISVAVKEFPLRVQKLFPSGTLDKEIKKELSKQGFDIKSYQEKEIASYNYSIFVCDFKWSITWKVNDRSNIYNLKAKYTDVCL